MKIRKVNIEDYSEVINLYIQLHDAEKVFDDNLVEELIIDEEQEKKIKRKMKSRKEIFLVAEIDSKVVGLIDGFIIDDIFLKEKIAYLDHICVDKNHRGKEIGTELIKEFQKISQKKGAKFVKLNAFKKNINAIKLYEKFGFKEHSSFYINTL